jgi:hypothetical protein
MFKNNKYSKWYFSIIDNAKLLNRDRKFQYLENHHIIPKSMGGLEKENLVLLTAREHFICHLLLTKMTLGVDRRNMSFALSVMSNRNRYYPKSSRLYESVRHLASNARKEHWVKLRENEEKYLNACQINRISQLGKKLSNEHKKKLRNKSELAGMRFTVESPSGEIFNPENFAAFCRDHKISHQTIKQSYWLGKNDRRVQKGPSKGWRITETRQK